MVFPYPLPSQSQSVYLANEPFSIYFVKALRRRRMSVWKMQSMGMFLCGTVLCGRQWILDAQRLLFAYWNRVRSAGKLGLDVEKCSQV